MNIEEAIEHCKEQAKVCSIKKCVDDHLQLAKWLEELKELRKLFTLTPEEMEIVRFHLEHKKKGLDSLLCQMDNDEYKDEDEYRRWESQYNEISYLLIKIKQWQDENNRTD